MEEARIKWWIIAVMAFLVTVLGGYLLFQVLRPKSQKVEVQELLPKVATPSAREATRSVKLLPRTGVPLVLVAIFATSATVAGFFLRKFPE